MPNSFKSLTPYLPVTLVVTGVIIAFTQLQAQAQETEKRVNSLETKQAIIEIMANDVTAVKTDVAWLKRVFEKYDITVQR